MNIRNKAIYSGALLALLGLGACDNIDEADRFLPYERPEVARKILIYEFTGQRCRNCPDGAQAVHSIQANNPGSVFAVNLHPENTVYTRPMGGLDLTCPEATFFYQYYTPSAFPAAVIGGAAPNYNIFSWSTAVDDIITIAAPATITLKPAYDETSRLLTVDYSVDFNEYTTYPISVQIYVIENGIVGSQSVEGHTVRDYVHNHVLRTSFYEGWGHNIGDAFHVEQSVEGSASVTLKDNWVADNCQIVACILSDGDKSVLQAEGCELDGRPIEEGKTSEE